MIAVIEQRDLERLRELIARRLGLQFDDANLDGLANVLRGRIGALAGDSAGRYVERLSTAPPRDAELRLLAEQLTVGETYFFRNLEQFSALQERVLPERLEARRAARQLRILSAGCSSGEEAYSIAILLRERFAFLEGWDIEIRGLDVNPAVLAKAAAARYSAWSLRETPGDIRSRWFHEEGREVVLDPAIRTMVAFEERNLLDDGPAAWPAAHYDVVFCRNVTMYFGTTAARGVVERIERSLVPGGYLFLGHAETLRGLSEAFHLCHTHGTFYYQRRAEAAPRAPHEPSWSSPRAPTIPLTLPDVTWVETIQRASDRIADLARTARVPSTGGSGEEPPTGSVPTGDLRGALDLLGRERFAEALDVLHGLPPGEESDADTEILRASLLVNAGKLRQAEEACRSLLARDELNAGAHYLMALCREHAGDHAEAAEHDQAAIYLDPTFAMPRLHLGLLAKAKGKPELARREIREALDLLAREDASRLLLFGGGFGREALVALCRAQLLSLGGAP